MSTIPSGFASVLYDNSDRAARLERIRAERARNAAVHGLRSSARYLAQNWFTEDFAIHWLSGQHVMLAPFWTALTGELRERMERAAEDLELVEPGARAQASMLLHQVADLLETAQ